MDASFWLKLLLSFIVGSLWVTLSTIIAERFGSKIGGLISGLPSTVVIALLFIGITQSPLVAAQATTVMPLAQGLNGIFLIVFMLLIRRGLLTASLSALGVWFLQSTFLYFLDLKLFWVSLAGWLVLLLLTYLVVEKWMKIASRSGLKISYPAIHLLWRALFGGTIIALAVLMGRIGGPMLGGIFGSFPAMFFTTLVISYKIGGAAFSRGMGKSMLISGLITVPLYEIAVRFLYPRLGLGLGTAVAVLLALGEGYLIYQFMRYRLT